MSEKFSLEGIYTPVITPFDEERNFDRDAMAEIVEHLVEKGVHGLISGGSTGENYAQTVEERLDVAKFTMECLKGRVPLIVGTGSMRTPDSIALAEGAKEMGADAIFVASPPYSVPTERENALNVEAIDRAADLPIVLYNYPARMGVNMGAEFLDIVGRLPNVVGMKESSGDINRVHLVAIDYPNIQLSCGMDDQAIEFFAWGARSWICAGSNFLPEEHVYLYETCVKNGDFSKGRRIMTAMMPLTRILEQGGKFIQCVKHGVELIGLRAGPTRPPLMALDENEKQELRQVVQHIKSAIANIKAGN